jgi:putative oxidoreductase
MDYGLLLLRVVVGLLFAAHGAQKAFGMFGGPGMAGVTGFMASLGFRSPRIWAWQLMLAELAGGLALAVGFLTPLASLALTIDMIVAIALVRWPGGWFAQNNGIEFEVTLLAVAVALVATGPGRFSLDRALDLDDNVRGLSWAAGVLGLSLVVAFFIITLGRGREAADVPA